MASKDINLKCGGETYHLDFSKFMYTEAKLLQKYTGLTVEALGPALKDGNIDAMAFLLWIAKKRLGDTTPFEEFDFDFLGLDIETQDEGEQVDDPADPTQRSGGATAEEHQLI